LKGSQKQLPGIRLAAMILLPFGDKTAVCGESCKPQHFI
jgi:hypothetical protein